MTEIFAKKVLAAGAQIESTKDQQGFMKGVDFTKENIWNDGTVPPDPQKCILYYDTETDDCGTLYASKVPDGWKWAYIEDIFSKEMYDAVLRHEKERDEEYM